MSGRVHCLRGKAESADIRGAVAAAVGPEAAEGRCVDVIISEWMGYALLYECMLGSVLSVRDRCAPTLGSRALRP